MHYEELSNFVVSLWFGTYCVDNQVMNLSFIWFQTGVNRISELWSAWEGPEIKSISVTSPASLLNLLEIFIEPLSKV